MEVWMIVVAVVVTALPFLLLAAFNRGERADSHGRRLDRRWRSPRTRI